MCVADPPNDSQVILTISSRSLLPSFECKALMGFARWLVFVAVVVAYVVAFLPMACCVPPSTSARIVSAIGSCNRYHISLVASRVLRRRTSPTSGSDEIGCFGVSPGAGSTMVIQMTYSLFMSSPATSRLLEFLRRTVSSQLSARRSARPLKPRQTPQRDLDVGGKPSFSKLEGFRLDRESLPKGLQVAHLVSRAR